MIRLFACDLDGTLLNERHESDAFIEGVLRSVVESGRYFTVATGRSTSMTVSYTHLTLPTIA